MAKKIPLYPRHGFARKLAKEFLLQSKVKSLPVNPMAICNQQGFIIRSVSEAEELIDELDPFDVRSNPECDAKTYLTSDGRYVIVYDDAVFSQGRIIWTIAHEIGHIVMGHLRDFEQTEIHKGLTLKENTVLEKEADTFASEFLAPAEVLIRCQCVKKNLIIKLCGLSEQAASYRENYLQAYEPNQVFEHIDQKLLKQFSSFIINKDFLINLHFKICSKCRNYILSSREHFCRVCGTNVGVSSLTKGIYYSDGPEMNSRKKVLACPKCYRRVEGVSSSLCNHCETSLVNACSNKTCNLRHLGSSRYCYKCGKPTHFLLNNTLGDWRKARRNYDKHRMIKSVLERDEDTGKVLEEWQYLLSFIKSEGKYSAYEALKDSIAKVDYDTLFIYSSSDTVRDWIATQELFCGYIIRMMSLKLGIQVIEIISLQLSEDGTISFKA